jgi:hypothetical protein
MKMLFDIGKGADFSECGKYRYRLWRIWNSNLPRAMIIGLNPSTANADTDDQTIMNLRRIMTALGYGGFYMMNCWPFITSKPELLQIDDGSNLFNDYHLALTAVECETVVFAWGNFKIIRDKGRDKELCDRFPNGMCFGKNKNGSPWHPLALMYNGTVKNPKLEKYQS